MTARGGARGDRTSFWVQKRNWVQIMAAPREGEICVSVVRCPRNTRWGAVVADLFFGSRRRAATACALACHFASIRTSAASFLGIFLVFLIQTPHLVGELSRRRLMIRISTTGWYNLFVQILALAAPIERPRVTRGAVRAWRCLRFWLIF